MKRDLERERQRRINEWVERKRLRIEDEKLYIEEEKLQNSRDFKEITFAITLFGGLLAFLIKLGDYFNNNVVVISDFSQYIIYFTIWITLILLPILLLYLILKWYLVSTKNENKWLKNITQYLFGLLPLFILVLFFNLIWNLFKYYSDNMSIGFYEYLTILMSISLMIMFVLSNHLINKNTFSLKKINYHVNIPTDDELLAFVNKIAIIVILWMLAMSSSFMFPNYIITGSYSIDKFPSSNTDNSLITFTIRETGFLFSYNNVILYKLGSGDSIIDFITINESREILSENKYMLGENHEGLWYLNLNTSNLTSGNYMLHAEVTNDMTKESKFGSAKKHDDIIFYIPPKTDLQSSNSTKQE